VEVYDLHGEFLGNVKKCGLVYSVVSGESFSYFFGDADSGLGD